MACLKWIYLLLFWVTLCCMHQRTTGQYDTLYYNLDDNTLETTFIGNIVNDAKLQLDHTADVLQKLTYIFLNKAPYLQYFILELNTGNIKASQLLDRDVVCPSQVVCQLELDIGIQPADYFRVIKAFIIIADENDNAPRFSDSKLTFELPESIQPGIIAPLTPATDLDSPPNGVVGYRLNDPSGKFSLATKNNTDLNRVEVTLVLLDRLDREMVDSYALTVVAYDGGQPSRSGTLDISVKVLDVNDNLPVFEEKTYNVVLNETFTINKTFLVVKATDGDSGLNGVVRYQFNPNTMRDFGDTFTINPETGEIKLKKTLDYETRSMYSLTIIAQDQGSNPTPSNAKVLITVLDVNDQPPQIIVNDMPVDGVLHVKENLPPLSFVAHISILDEEHGDNGLAQCDLESNEFFKMASLQYEKEYQILTLKSIDREVNNRVTIKVKCHDLGQPRLFAEKELVVVIDDENDNSPVFVMNSMDVQLEEGNYVGSRVTKVEATDADSGLNSEIRYYCEHEFFDVNTIDGVVTAKKTFDREEKEVYYLHIMATDLGEEPHENTTTLAIHIVDADDNKPTFVEKTYKMNITENSPLNSYIGKVEAFDLDGPLYNKFYYYLGHSDEVEKRFRVDNKTGAIYTNVPLDRELKSQFKIQVVVHVPGSNLDTDSTMVIIDILDENDNAPIISFPTPQTNNIILSNKAPVGYKVTKVIAYDIDSGNNSIVSFQLVEHGNGDYFYIDVSTGNIYVNKELWSAADENITLKILVSDFGQPRRTSVATLYIAINSTVAHVSLSMPSEDSTSTDLIAIIVGCICGVLIISLIIVLFCLLCLRSKRRRKQQNSDTAHQSWSDTSLNDKSDHKGSVNVVMSRHYGDGQEERHSPTGGSGKAGVYTEDMEITITEPTLQGQRTHTPPVNMPGERDSDSGCFDLSHSDSQSSSDTPHYTGNNTVSKVSMAPSNPLTPSTHSNSIATISGPTLSTVVQTKCYHPHAPHHLHSHQPVATSSQKPYQSSVVLQDDPINTEVNNLLNSTPDYLNSSKGVGGGFPMSTFNPQQPGNSTGILPNDGLNSVYKGLDFVQPTVETKQGKPNKPKPPPRFSDYLQNESQQLKQRGHVYRVSSPRNKVKPSNSVKKTVRFSEPDESGGSPRAVPNEYVSSVELAGFKTPNTGAYIDNGLANGAVAGSNIDSRENNSNNNIECYELDNGEQLQLNSLV